MHDHPCGPSHAPQAILRSAAAIAHQVVSDEASSSAVAELLDDRRRDGLGVGAAPYELLEALIELGYAPAVRALVQVRLQLRAGRPVGLFVQVGPEVAPGLVAVAYFGRTHSCPSSSNPRSAANSQSVFWSWRRPRCRRDITVPIEVPMMSAISL